LKKVRKARIFMDLEKIKPHFADIAHDLLEGIQAGRFAVGSFLPTEFELRDHYGTSRHTVRAALHELEQLGLVSRRKNVGTRVESSEPTKPFRPTLASVDDLVQFGAAHIRAVQSIEDTVAKGALAKELGCANGARWLRISSLRLRGNANNAPIGWTDVYLDPAYADIADTIRASPDTLISSLVESRYGRRIAEIQQDIKATIASEKMALKLHVDTGTPMLKIVRRYLDMAGQIFEASVTFHPAERFSLSMRLRRSVG
jgi:GntR family transcriptional regulator